MGSSITISSNVTNINKIRVVYSVLDKPACMGQLIRFSNLGLLPEFEYLSWCCLVHMACGVLRAPKWISHVEKA